MGNRVWEQRVRLLTVQRTRQRLLQWGYKPADIPKLFALVDRQSKGGLTYAQFRRMMALMNVGLGERRVSELFDTFDRDGGGSVDTKEFMHEVFPEAYYEWKGAIAEREGLGYRSSFRPSAFSSGTCA